MSTALIVEDEPEANRLLSLLVHLRGYATQSAFAGGEALRMAERSPPDVVFLDLMLPDTNGFDVCRHLKGRRRTNPIPVIMVTARMASESRAASFRAGAMEFVSKPYTPEQIFDALEAADRWRRSLADHGPVGEVHFRTGDEVEASLEVSRIQSLLLGRTPWIEDAVRLLAQDLGEMARNLLDWGDRHRATSLATIRFELHPDRAELLVRDLAGWCGSSDLPHEEAFGLLLGRGRFDSVSYDDSGNEATLIKRFPAADPPPT